MFGFKQKLPLCVLVIPFVLSMSGCATTSPSDGKTASKSDASSRSALYIHQVRRAAARNNVRVIWVNPPEGDRGNRLSYTLKAKVGDEDSDR